jgi:hypothetical protein
VRRVGRHDDDLPGGQDVGLARNRDLGLAIDDESESVKRGGVLAEPLARVESEGGDRAPWPADKLAADNGARISSGSGRRYRAILAG